CAGSERWSHSLCCVSSVFFFSSRRRHTRFSRDWSSDVCSSDLCRTVGSSSSAVISPRCWPTTRPSASISTSVGHALIAYARQVRDRKSTRLNSSHVKISYAVFCLKKKKKLQCAVAASEHDDRDS